MRATVCRARRTRRLEGKAGKWVVRNLTNHSTPRRKPPHWPESATTPSTRARWRWIKVQPRRQQAQEPPHLGGRINERPMSRPMSRKTEIGARRGSQRTRGKDDGVWTLDVYGRDCHGCGGIRLAISKGRMDQRRATMEGPKARSGCLAVDVQEPVHPDNRKPRLPRRAGTSVHFQVEA